MSELWSPFVKNLVPYVPGEQPKLTNLVKLNTNENPYGPSPRALDAIRAAATDDLRLYPDPNGQALKDAVAQVEDQEDEHLYHTTGWSRELWMGSLGLTAVLPPPEEQKHVKTAIGASRARQAREEMT